MPEPFGLLTQQTCVDGRLATSALWVSLTSGQRAAGNGHSGWTGRPGSEPLQGFQVRLAGRPGAVAGMRR
jgi:hypothetical protein